MRTRLRFLVWALGFAILFAVGYRHGSPIWSPLVGPLRGQETVSSVLESLAEKGKGLSPEEEGRYTEYTLVGLKRERTLELWGRLVNGKQEQLRSYPFTAFSGTNGPKLREGDGQIPEGIYRIVSLNPNSSYHLSMELDYPNAFDRKRGEEDGRDRLGNEIFIHGRAVTIGCIPIGDDAIEDLFAIVATEGREEFSVIIAPHDFRIDPEEPELEEISWEEDLYEMIREALEPFATEGVD